MINNETVGDKALNTRRGFSPLLFTVVLTAALGLFVTLFWREYQESRQFAAVAAQNVVRMLSSNFEDMLQRTESNLRSFSHVLRPEDLDRPVSPARRAEIEAMLTDHLVMFDKVSNYRVFKADGSMVFGAGTGNTNFNVSDRSWFRSLRDDPSQSLLISDVLIGKGTLVPTVIMAVPIRDRDGALVGGALAALNISFFQTLMNSLDLGPNGLMAIRRVETGSWVLRHPDLPANPGPTGTSSILDLVAQGQNAGEVESVSPVDGVDRLNVFFRLPNHPFVVFAGIAKTDYLHTWRREVGMVGSAAAIFALLLGFLFGRTEKAKAGLAEANGDLLARESSLKDNEKRFRATFEQAAMGLAHNAFDGRFLQANARFCQIAGYPPEEVGALSFQSLIHPDDRPAALAVLEKLATGELDKAELEQRCLRKDGQPLWIRATCSVQRDVGGQPLHIITMIEDISEQRRAEMEILQLVAYQEAILANTPVGIAIIGLDRTIIEVNKTFCRIFNTASHELKGCSSRVLYSDQALFDDIGRRAYPVVGAGGTFSDEVRMVRSDGSQIMARLMARSVNPQKPELGVVWSAEDISARKALELELTRSNAELEAFAYVASHDLRQPLRQVSSYVTLLEREYAGKLDDDAREFIGFARSGAERMDRLIVDLLDYSRIGRSDKAKTRLDLADCVNEAILNLANAIEEAEARVTVDMASDLPAFEGDRVQIVRLVQNLLGNAIKYRAKDRPPVLTLTARTGASGMVEMAIKDNGIGIKAEHFDRIFGIFQRLHGRGEYEGTGIGLASCKKIVEHHHGSIWLESVEGLGSTFHVVLPALPASLA